MYIAKNLMWPAHSDGRVEISIGFLHPNKHHSLQKDVKHFAHAWEKAVPCLYFNWKDDPKHCRVRIDFWDSADGSSEIGRISKDHSDDVEATMNLPKGADHDTLKQTTLHEFGHMLGAVHEQFNPAFPWKWNKKAIIDSIEDNLRATGDDYGNEIPADELSQKARQMAETEWWKSAWADLDEKDQLYSEFDPDSIMVYPIPAKFMERKHHHGPHPEAIYQGWELSDLDKSTMRRAYCGESPVNQSPPSQQSGGWYYPYSMPYYPPASNQAQSVSYSAPSTNNICGNPDCGRTFICKDDYNRRVRAGGAPGVP